MNPLYEAMVNAKQGQIPASGALEENYSDQSWIAQMGRLQANPGDMLRKRGYSVPDELTGNPQAMVMHLMQSGQINSPMMQRIRPYLQRMGIH